MPGGQAKTSRSGRPLHPPFVHAPIGGVVIAAVCDLVSAIGDPSHPWTRSWFKGGSYALIVGTGTLLLAIGSGLVDRARQTQAGGRERAAVFRHAAVMALVAVVCIVDLVLRTAKYDTAQQTPGLVLVLSLIAVVLAAVGGELGGRLVYRRAVAVQLGEAEPRAGDGRPTAGAPERLPATRTG